MMSSVSDKTAALNAQAPAMLALLKRMEWIYDPRHAHALSCQFCYAGIGEGHKADCELNVVLKSIEECPATRP